MCQICGECNNYFAVTLGVFKNHGMCLLNKAVVHEDDLACQDFKEEDLEEEQGW